jgi:hypothetical protein
MDKENNMKTEDIRLDEIFENMDCKYKVPSIHITKEDDGSFILEWIFSNHTRIGLNIETDSREHGWHIVTKQIAASGPLELKER